MPSRTPTPGTTSVGNLNQSPRVVKTMAAIPITSARSLRTPNAFIRPDTSKRSIAQSHAALNVVAAHEADFQTSSAEIQNKLRRHSFRKRTQHGGTHQASFLGGADDLESNAGLAVDAPDQRVPVGRLANSAGGHGAVFPDVVAIEQAAKMTESLGGTRQGEPIKPPLGEHIMAQ